MPQKYIWLTKVFYWKFLRISNLTPFFSHISHKFYFYHTIRLLNCYKNIYGLHRFSIENSSKLDISHLFWPFNTFLSHLFRIFFSLCTTTHSYQSIKKRSKSIPIMVLKFCLGTRFVTSYGRTHGRTDELFDYNTSSRP